jgi:isocitrate dehydrogenase
MNNVEHCLALGGEWITGESTDRLAVPDTPIIGFIEGDGVGPDIWSASRMVFDEAVRVASQGRKKVCWIEIPAGEKSFERSGEYLPDSSLDLMRTRKDCDQRTFDHAGWRGNSQPERDAQKRA